MNRHFTAAACLLAGLLAVPAFGQSPKHPKVRVYAGGSYFPTSTSFDQTTTYTEFVEDATVEGSFSRKKGAGGELSLEFDFTQAVGVAAGGHFTNRKSDVDFTARLPHPFFFNRPRLAEGSDRLEFSEKVLHLDLVYNGLPDGLVGFSIFGGPSLFKVKADLLAPTNTVTKTSVFPFDEVTVTGLNTVELDDTAFGFNVGAGIDFRFSKNAGIGVRARFSRATISSNDPEVETKAGGLAVGGGLSLRF